VTSFASGVLYTVGVVLIVAIAIGLPFLVLWLLSLYAPRNRSGVGQRLAIMAMRTGRVPPWGSAGGSHSGDYDLKATESSVRGILGEEPGPEEIRAARAYLLEVAFDPMLLAADLREQLGAGWAEHPLDHDPAPYLARLLGDDPGPTEVYRARRYLLATGCDPALLPGRIRRVLGMEWTEHQGSRLDKAVRGVSSLLGPEPGPDEIAAALRYLAHTGYDPSLLPEDMAVMLGVDGPRHLAQADGALT
jgi:hypothetical protein